MKKIDKLKDFFWNDIGGPIDAILVVGGLVLLIGILLSLPKFLIDLLVDISQTSIHINLGEIIGTVIIALIGIVVLILMVILQ